MPRITTRKPGLLLEHMTGPGSGEGIDEAWQPAVGTLVRSSANADAAAADRCILRRAGPIFVDRIQGEACQECDGPFDNQLEGGGRQAENKSALPDWTNASTCVALLPNPHR